MGNFWDFCRTTHQARPPRAGSRCFDSAAFNSILFKDSGAATRRYELPRSPYLCSFCWSSEQARSLRRTRFSAQFGGIRL